jgi:hypothetical protein
MTTTPPSTISFDDFKHEYRLNGRPVPSVTRVISNISEDLLLNSNFIRKTAIGTLVHQICDKIKADEAVDFDSMGEEIKPYVMGYLKFREQVPYRLVDSEMRVFSKKYSYAGTVDDIYLNDKGQLAVLDIKTSSVISPTTKLQTAAYAHAIDEMKVFEQHGKVKERGCIWLLGNGDYKLVNFVGKEDFQVFLCHLTVFNWRQKEGVK